MTVQSDTIWPIEPHTKAKHEILRRYLEAWFPILSRHFKKAVYIDGFCGPGHYSGGEPGSPLIALEVAKRHGVAIAGDLWFWFIDERKDRIEHLKAELAKHQWPANFHMRVECGLFHQKVEPVFDLRQQEGASAVPIFAFVDPFGFKGLPFSLISRILGLPSCEVFVNLMVEPINRWIEHPNEAVVSHILDAFGSDEALQIVQAGGNRIGNLRSLYQHQLETVARFVRYFEMRDETDHTKYFLFFASNHRLGHVKMKEAMWKIDPLGTFSFSDATDPNQLTLFTDEQTDAQTDALCATLLAGFARGRRTQVESVRICVEDKTAFIRKHLIAALKKLEEEGRVSVDKLKSDGKTRKMGTFPDEALITYL